MSESAPREPSTRRIPYPPSALSAVSPEVARAVSAPFSGGAWIASAFFLLPAVVLTAILGDSLRGFGPEGRRRVLTTGLFLIQLIAAAGAVAVHSRRSRDRIEKIETDIPTLGRWWLRTAGLTSGLSAAFLVAWVALGGAIDSLAEVASRSAQGGGTLGLFRIVPLGLATLMAVDLAVLAFAVSWISAIRTIEGCTTGVAASILRGLWAKSRSRLLLHASAGALATWLTWLGMNAAVGAIFALAVPQPLPDTAAALLYDHALRTWLVWTPPLAVLASAGVSSYLLLRPLNGAMPP